jgi:propanol-preferring alcohol dehydrogenase
MRAAVLREFGKPLCVEDVPVPEPGAGELLVRVHACGVCHSDLHLAEADWALLKPITKMPLILGHEVAGTVEKTGEGVAGFVAGDRVGVPWLHWTCGTCEYCASGRETLCSKQAITGVTVDGGYAEFLLAKASHVTPIPGALTFAEAAPLLCAGLTAYKGLKAAGLKAGEKVCVFGVGGLGHLAVQIAKAKGAEVYAVDVDERKLALAKECGADWAGREKPQRSHVVIVTSASKAAYEAAFKAIRKGGTLVVVGMPAEPVPFSAVSLVAGEYRIIGSAVGTREDLREMMELAGAGKVRCRFETRPLEDAGHALEDLKAGRVNGRIVLAVAKG